MSVLTCPRTDERRRRELLQQLEAAAVRFVPSWRGLTEPGDPGRALLQIGAYLAEHVTSRLDVTADRDLKAFLNWLAIPGQAPTSAEAWLVFTLGEKLDRAVQVNERIQASAPGSDGDEVIFETSADMRLTLTPARILSAFGVDPGSDRIERAPTGFASLEPSLASDPPYQLLSFAGAAARQVQITPAIGLEKGDWVRIAEAVYEIAEEKEGIYRINPGLDAAAPAGTSVSRVTRFQPGAMRDLQRHAFYVGHKELLNLEQTAAIDLHILPQGAAAWLAGREIAWELWGKRQGAEEADWQALEAAVGASSVHLRKSWIGKTEEREVAGEKSRWLRARLLDPMIGDRVSLRCDRLELELSSGPPEKKPGSPPTVTGGFHNSTPLPVGHRFLPFGPEPRLFDQFYLAAPETFSKHGAKALLDIKIADASIVSVTGVRGGDGEFASFGISRRGHLQLIRRNAAGSFLWRDLGRPGAVESATGPDPDTADVAIDGHHQPAVLAFPNDPANNPRYFVAAPGVDGRIWSILVTFDQNSEVSTTGWTGIEGARGENLSLDLVALPKATADPAGVAGYLLRAGDTGLSRVNVNGDGSVEKRWSSLGNAGGTPGFGASMQIVGVQSDDWPEPPDVFPYELVLIDHGGDCWLGGLQGNQIAWTRLKHGFDNASTSVRPAASRNASSKILLLTAAPNRKAVDLYLHDPAVSATDFLGRSGTLDIKEGSALKSLFRNSPPGRHLISLTEVTEAGQRATALLDGVSVGGMVTSSLGDLRSSVLTTWFTVDSGGEVVLLVAGTQETVSRQQILLDAMTVDELRDAVILENEADTAHLIEVFDVDAATYRPIELQSAVMRDAQTNRRIYGIEQGEGLDQGDSYEFFKRIKTYSNGAIQGTDRLELDPDTNHVPVTNDSRISISGTLHRVSNVDSSATPPVVTLFPDINANDPVEYRVFEKHGNPGQVSNAHLGAIGEIATANDNVALGLGDRLILPAGADPSVQTIVDFRDDPVPARFDILFGGTWSAQPATPAEVFRVSALPASVWQPIPFERSYQNPELVWEYFDGNGWRRLEKGFFDETGHFVVSGRIGFEVPSDLSQNKIAGKEDYWIRTRLIGGDYGQPVYRVENEPVNLAETIFNSKITIDNLTVNPPEILKIDASFKLDDRVPPELTLIDNNLALVNQTAAAAARGAVFDLFAAAATLDPGLAVPALYLELSKPFSVDALRVLADVAEQEGEFRLAWEVCSEGRWLEVPVVGEDPTKGLMRPGIVTLNVRTKPTQHTLFGRAAFWMRAHALGGGSWRPDIQGIHANAAPAEQAETLTAELLGSSTGEPNASFQLAKTPVLPGSVKLRIREQLGTEEKAALTRAKGSESVLENQRDLPGEWVLWEEVDSFFDAQSDARVYVLDAQQGVVSFGDGRRGRIPPAGPDNVRAFSYQFGGGRTGNVAAFGITSLKSAVTGVEAVTNPLPTRGGSDGRDEVASVAQATSRVRHVNRAIALRDVETLALGYAPEIVRARCLGPEGPSRKIVVVVAIAAEERMPQPSVALRDGLAGYLTDLASDSWSAETFEVVGPEYVRLSVGVELTLGPNSPATLGSRVRERLLALLHPVTGGHDGKGWPFGRGLWPSDVHRALADLLGDARIAEPEITRVDNRGAASRIGRNAIIAAEEDDIGILPGATR